MNAAIIVCSTLTNHVKAAQKKMNTNYPIIELDNSKHSRPEKFWQLAFLAMEQLPEEIDTVLLGLGVCGGASVGWTFPRRTIMPKVDDCITLLMHTDEKFHYNLKEVGHFYLTENRDLMSIEQMEQDLVLKYGERRAKRVMKVWFDAYKSVDIVDTGVYDCYSKEYVERAKRESAIINVPYQYVPGSNIILEKIVSGKWDDQFLIIEKGGVMTEEDFGMTNKESLHTTYVV